jgi:hypothetical protein
VNYRISVGRNIQILADTQDMVTDTLRVTSTGIMQVWRDAGLHLPTFNQKIQKILHSTRTKNQSRSPKFLRRPHFVGDFLCKRSCFNLQLSSESSCKAPSFYVWKTWGRFSDSFCDCFVFRVCSGFRVMFRGGGSENLWKTELDWVLGILFRV